MLTAYSIGLGTSVAHQGLFAVSVHSLGVACRVRGGVAYQG